MGKKKRGARKGKGKSKGKKGRRRAASGALLDLMCIQCDAIDEYDVGRVLVLPDDEGAPAEARWGFTHCFWCSQCGAGGPWLPSAGGLFSLTCLLLRYPEGESNVVAAAGLGVFDGTVHQYGSQVVEHLQALITQRPDDAFLHDRLGNSWEQGGRPGRAVTAWQRAVALDPDLPPPLFSLGKVAWERADCAEAAGYLHRLLISAHRFAHDERFDVKPLVETSLDILIEAHHESGGAVELLPTMEPGHAPGAPESATPTLYLTDFDLSDERDWSRLVGMWLVPAGPERTAALMRRSVVRGKEDNAPGWAIWS